MAGSLRQEGPQSAVDWVISMSSSLGEAPSSSLSPKSSSSEGSFSIRQAATAACLRLYLRPLVYSDEPRLSLLEVVLDGSSPGRVSLTNFTNSSEDAMDVREEYKRGKAANEKTKEVEGNKTYKLLEERFSFFKLYAEERRRKGWKLNME
ncbi:UNVERIFIED_CONTAM: hypothetical protein Slati_3798100 [Sesamum latifolium]|uniref:Uncharacterized protein n=1 Tax=Sesamum latifolium TaxID=2727402 RepID=A0AAW2U5G9_9LAMI